MVGVTVECITVRTRVRTYVYTCTYEHVYYMCTTGTRTNGTNYTCTVRTKWYVYVTLKVVPWYSSTMVPWYIRGSGMGTYALKAINTQFASVSRTAPFILAHKSVEFPRNYCTEAELRCDRFLDLENRVGGTS